VSPALQVQISVHKMSMEFVSEILPKKSLSAWLRTLRRLRMIKAVGVGSPRAQRMPHRPGAYMLIDGVSNNITNWVRLVRCSLRKIE